jgi:hypothetical protein
VPGAGFVRAHVLGERGVVARQLLVELGNARPAGGVELATCVDEIGVVAVDQSSLFLGQRCGRPADCLDPPEQPIILRALAPELGKAGLDVALDRLKLGGAHDLGPGAVDLVRPVERPPGILECGDRVVERTAGSRDGTGAATGRSPAQAPVTATATITNLQFR